MVSKYLKITTRSICNDEKKTNFYRYCSENKLSSFLNCRALDSLIFVFFSFRPSMEALSLFHPRISSLKYIAEVSWNSLQFRMIPSHDDARHCFSIPFVQQRMPMMRLCRSNADTADWFRTDSIRIRISFDLIEEKKFFLIQRKMLNELTLE